MLIIIDYVIRRKVILNMFYMGYKMSYKVINDQYYIFFYSVINLEINIKNYYQESFKYLEIKKFIFKEYID